MIAKDIESEINILNKKLWGWGWGWGWEIGRANV
jgi:hypothetical protein